MEELLIARSLPDEQLAAGLVEENRRLVAMGYGYDLPSMSGIGYGQIGRFLRGEISLDEAVQQIKNETHRFARQQYTWFRLGDPRIHWLRARPDLVEVARQLVTDFLQEESVAVL